jgi:hypothetical protein
MGGIGSLTIGSIIHQNQMWKNQRVGENLQEDVHNIKDTLLE